MQPTTNPGILSPSVGGEITPSERMSGTGQTLQITEHRRLVLQENGMIVLETRGDRFVRTSAARDLQYRLQYKSIKGWWEITGWFEDELTARQMLREANPNIRWRLVAYNEHGAIALPNSWRGYCS